MSKNGITRCFLTLAFILCVSFIVGTAPAFGAVIAGFEVDANLTSSTDQDWDSETNNALISDSPSTISPNDNPPAAHDNPDQPGTAALSYDYISTSGLVDSNIFTGGSKETLYDPDSGLMNWDIVSGNIPPNKDDVSLVYTWKDDDFNNLVAGMERLNTLGDAHLNFGLDHKPWKPCPNGTATVCRDPEEGDLLLVIDLKGTTPTARLFIWEEPGGDDVRNTIGGIPGGTTGCDGEITGGGNLKKSCVDSKTGADRRGWEEIFPIPANTVEILTNSVAITAGPWGSFGPGGSIRNTIPAGTFFEVYANLQALGFEPACPVFGVFTVRSRASESIDSELKDLAGPIELGLVCDDGNLCTTDTCDEATGGCSFTPVDCNDNDKCTDDSCDAVTGQCVHTPTIADCNDSDKCTDDACTNNACQNTPTIADCNDSDICTDDECIANACVNTFDPTNDPSCAPGEAVCRTPGFWGTHAGTEKNGSNITRAVIDACGGCLDVCGEIINNTDLDSGNSAVEAICVSPGTDIRHQLARQLTAMSLNCCISGFGSDCLGGDSSLINLYNSCNIICTSSMDTSMISSCINQIDCFNNGGVTLPDGLCQIGTCSDDNEQPCNEGDLSRCIDPLTATCVPTPGNCHDQPLCNESLVLCFDPPGPAGSSKACDIAIGDGKGKNAGNDCAILPKASGAECSKFNQGEECCGTDAEGTCQPCAHGICTTGSALSANCDPCVALICVNDSSCCDTAWDETCVEEVSTICGLSCD